MKHIIFVTILVLTSHFAWGMDDAPLLFVSIYASDGSRSPILCNVHPDHEDEKLNEITLNTYFIKPYQAGHYETQQIVDARDKALLITNLKTKKVSWLHDVRAALHDNNNPSCIAFNVDGSLVAAGYKTRSDSWADVVLWNITQKIIEGICLSSDCREVTALVFAPQGREFAAGYEDGSIILWADQMLTNYCHTKAVLALAYNRLGQLASSSKDLTIKIWQNSDYGLQCKQIIQLGKIQDIIGFYPDESTLFSCNRYKIDEINFHKINF